jgi:hypothetical protein
MPVAPNGSRYPLVGGTGERRFAGTNLKPRKLPENAQTPTTMAPAHFAGDRVLACKRDPQGLRSGTFLDTLGSFSERERVSGNAA